MLEPRVLYLVYWGAAEPLGQSLVLPSVVALAGRGARVRLVTFEKGADLDRPEQVAAIRDRLRAAGVAWHPLRYHKRPKLPATAWDVIQGIGRGLAARLAGDVDVVHARTFVAGNAGLVLAPLLRRPLVYHNEGYYPDEQVDAGVWRASSLLYRAASRIESRLYASADGLVLLSHASRQELMARPALASRRPPAIVVPSCVDLRLFPPPAPGPRAPGPLRLAYVGNVEGRYLFERVARFAAVAGARLRVLTRASHAWVDAKARAAGLPTDRLSVASVPHAEVARELAGADAGLHFLPQGRADHAGSPTKVGEYWACGLPCVVTPRLGDSEAVVMAERVGVVVREHDDDSYRQAALRLTELLDDPGHRQRCRAAAERHFGLDPAVERQLALYDELLRRARR